MTLPLGTDSMYIPVNESDPGSIIAFVLASNIYKEALIKQNYMDLGQKIKGLGKHIRQTHTGEKSNNIDSTNVTPMAPKDSANI